MKFAKNYIRHLPKSSFKAIPSIDVYTDGPDEDVDENQYENLEDSCRISLAKKMPFNWYIPLKISNNDNLTIKK